jgi:hypothetical protein
MNKEATLPIISSALVEIMFSPRPLFSLCLSF